MKIKEGRSSSEVISGKGEIRLGCVSHINDVFFFESSESVTETNHTSNNLKD